VAKMGFASFIHFGAIRKLSRLSDQHEKNDGVAARSLRYRCKASEVDSLGRPFSAARTDANHARLTTKHRNAPERQSLRRAGPCTLRDGYAGLTFDLARIGIRTQARFNLRFAPSRATRVVAKVPLVIAL
jgi:hypothetical protein